MHKSNGQQPVAKQPPILGNGLWAYMYLDEPSIESLYAQAYGNIVEEKSVYGGSSLISGSFGVKALGVIKAKMKGESAESSIEEIKTLKSAAEKAHRLIQELRSEDPSLIYVLQLLPPQSLFVGTGKFVLDDVIDGETGQSVLDPSTEIAHIGTHDDVVFQFSLLGTGDSELLTARVIMRLSNRHFKKSFFHYAADVRQGALFSFNVFGQTPNCAQNDEVLVPFAVW